MKDQAPELKKKIAEEKDLLPYEAPRVESLRLSDEAAEALT